MDKIERIKELTAILNKAGRAYYSGDKEVMSNYDYDMLYDELLSLENETGFVAGDSPTVNVGYETLSELPKEEHETPMLSLNKTKSVEELAEFAGDRKCLLSWKLDGLTIVLTYEKGELAKAVTRGNGYVGEVITANAKTFVNLPAVIPYKGKLVIRGEAIITYSNFERINASLLEGQEPYKNPRNLCSGTVRQLNSKITAQRKVVLNVFALISADGVDFSNSRLAQFEWLKSQGFDVVEHVVADRGSMAEAVEGFAKKVEKNDFPSDGLVLTYDDIAYGESLGTTAKFPRHSIAFKWRDEVVDTHLIKVEWSASRTGLINPVAIFEPVEIEGTTVSRASVHNVSIVRSLMLGEGDVISVYKANMIIPQIAENKTRSNTLAIPDVCPVCLGRTSIMSKNEVESLYCDNPDCQAKHIGSFELLVSRDALNIDGMSVATLEKFIDAGFVRNFADIFHLDRYREEICSMEGFGEKSFDNLMASVKNARNVPIRKFIYSLGIPGVGLSNAGIICRHFDSNLESIMHAEASELTAIDGIGDVIASAVVDYFSDGKKLADAKALAAELNITDEPGNQTDTPVSGKVFVITGSVMHFANRNEVKELIESMGGKVSGSVSAKTDYLINNDTTSSSSKNKKAKELNIPIISEEDFLRLIGR